MKHIYIGFAEQVFNQALFKGQKSLKPLFVNALIFNEQALKIKATFLKQESQ